MATFKQGGGVVARSASVQCKQRTMTPTGVSALSRTGLVGALFLLVLPVAAAQASVDWSNGLLSVKARGQPLSVVMREIEARTNIVVKNATQLVGTVTRDFDQLPLAEGLRQLLSAHNYLIVEGARQRTAMVIVLGDGMHAAQGLEASAQAGPMAGKFASGAAVLVPASRGGSARAVSAPAEPSLERELASSDPAARIDAVERLGDRGDARSLALVQRALSDPSDAVRAVAQQALATRGATANANVGRSSQ